MRLWLGRVDLIDAPQLGTESGYDANPLCVARIIIIYILYAYPLSVCNTDTHYTARGNVATRSTREKRTVRKNRDGDTVLRM